MIRKKRNEVFETGISASLEVSKLEGEEFSRFSFFSSPPLPSSSWFFRSKSCASPRRVITVCYFRKAFVLATQWPKLPSRGKLNFPLFSLFFSNLRSGFRGLCFPKKAKDSRSGSGIFFNMVFARSHEIFENIFNLRATTSFGRSRVIGVEWQFCEAKWVTK